VADDRNDKDAATLLDGIADADTDTVVSIVGFVDVGDAVTVPDDVINCETELDGVTVGVVKVGAIAAAATWAGVSATL